MSGAGPRDPGLAEERTELARSRSALALLACGAAVARGVPDPAGGGRPAAGTALLVLGVVAWAASVPLQRARGRRAGAARAPELLVMAIGTALVGVAALVLAAVSPA